MNLSTWPWGATPVIFKTSSVNITSAAMFSMGHRLEILIEMSVVGRAFSNSAYAPNATCHEYEFIHTPLKSVGVDY